MLEKLILLAMFLHGVGLILVLIATSKWNKENNQPSFKEKIKSNIKCFKECIKSNNK